MFLSPLSGGDGAARGTPPLQRVDRVREGEEPHGGFGRETVATRRARGIAGKESGPFMAAAGATVRVFPPATCRRVQTKR